MRVVSVLLSLVIVTGLALWFQPWRERPGPVAVSVGSADAAQTVAGGADRADAPVPVMVLETVATETRNRLLVRGRTMANRRVEVDAETVGLVVSEPLRRGARIEAGQLLCRLDPGSRPAQLREAEARLAEARADLDAADRLTAQGFTAATTRNTRQAEFEAAQAGVDLIRLDIARLEIRAPFSGVLESDTAELGALLSAGESCATVIDLSTIRAAGFVNEQAVDLIAEGQHARVRLVNGRVADGEISFIARVADEETRTYEVEIALPNAEERLRDGMTAELDIDLPAVRAHRIPQSALTLDDQGRLGVRLAEGTTARFVPVRILRDERNGVWVAGLGERASVIVVGQEFVRDGRPIRPSPVTWDELG